MKRSAIYTLVIFLILNSSIFSKIIYVAQDGNDTTNTGTIGQPLVTLQKAQELASPGDTVYIRGGTYKIQQDQISKVVSNLFACITYLDKSGI
jgi:Pel9A-like, right handed beta helix region